MPRLIHKNPSYQKHKASGQAVVCLNGEDVYLGLFGSKASRDAYDRVIGEWLANGRQRPRNNGEGLYVSEVIQAFWNHAKATYKNPDGSPSGELDNYRLVLRVLRRLYGNTPAADFGPKALKAARAEMIKMGWTRKSINRQISRIKHVFNWAGSEEIIPPTIAHGLTVVKGLKKGKEGVKEAPKVRSIAPDAYDAILGHLPAPVRAIVELQNHTGARQGELFIMRTCDITQTTVDGHAIWEYRPNHHKTEHHEIERVILIGPRGQAVLAPLLKTDLQAYIFTPDAALRERRERMAKTRKTPLSCGNVVGSNVKANPKVRPGNHYDSHSYRRAIKRACEKAFNMPKELRKSIAKPAVPTPAAMEEWTAKETARRTAASAWRKQHCWTPHRLRHTAAKRLRKEHGLDTGQTLLGHQVGSRITELYAEAAWEKANHAILKTG